MDINTAKQYLMFVMQTDIRLRVHTFSLKDGIYKHTKACPRCGALNVLGYTLDSEIAIDYY